MSKELVRKYTCKTFVICVFVLVFSFEILTLIELPTYLFVHKMEYAVSPNGQLLRLENFSQQKKTNSSKMKHSTVIKNVNISTQKVKRKDIVQIKQEVQEHFKDRLEYIKKGCRILKR